MAERLRLIVVVIPGLGGSVLASPDGSWRVGPRPGDAAACLRRPERLSRDVSPRLVPVDLVRSAQVGPWRLAGGYGGLLSALDQRYGGPRVEIMNSGRRPPRDPGSANVLLFPYDYRLGVRDAAARLGECMDARLGPMDPERERAGRPVVVLAHSMGGLVARHWVARGNGAQYCRTLITLGTPHRGAPQMLDELVNGVGVGRVRYGPATAVLRDWPSAYELLPQYRVVLPAGQLGNRLPALTDLRRPGELEGSLVGRAFLSGAGAGRGVHDEIAAGWLALRRAGRDPEVIPVCGRGHATLTHFEEHGGRLRGIADHALACLPFGDWRGDGTVPVVSTLPLELDEHRGTWRTWAYRHRLLPSAEDVLDLLSRLNGETTAPIHRVGTPRPLLSLGLDLPDLAVGHEPVDVCVELVGDHVPEARRGRVSVRDADSGLLLYDGALRRRDREPGTGERNPDSNRGRHWGDRIPGLPAGLYSVKARLSGIPRSRDIVTEDLLAVVDA